jgi:hypothetical protein
MLDRELNALLLRAEQGDEQARDTLYDDYGVNDDDRGALLAHAVRHAAPVLATAYAIRCSCDGRDQ